MLQCIVCNSSSILFMHTIQASWLSGWSAGLGNSGSKGHGFNPSCDQLFSFGRGQWRDCKLSQSGPSSKWVSGEGKQEGVCEISAK